MNVSSVNVVLTTNPEAIKTFFFGGTLSPVNKPIIEIENFEDSFVFVPGKDNGLIELIHFFENGRWELNLTFIDPQKSFENNILKHNIFEQVQSLVQKYKVDTKPRNKSGKKNQIFVAYGMGDDRSTWSIHAGDIAAANVDYGSGTRKFALTIVPKNGALLSEMRFKDYGDNETMLFPNLPKNTKLYIDGKSKTVDTYEKAGQLDYHLIVTDALKSYLQRATATENVLILLPDINRVMKPVIEDLDKSFYSNVSVAASPNLGRARQLGVLREFLNRLGMNIIYKADHAQKMGRIHQINYYYKDFPEYINGAAASISTGLSDKPDTMEAPLKAFKKGFVSSYYNPELNLIVESDIRLLDLIRIHLGIGDGIQPLVIFGDQRIIDDVIYNKFASDIIRPNFSSGPIKILDTDGKLKDAQRYGKMLQNLTVGPKVLGGGKNPNYLLHKSQEFLRSNKYKQEVKEISAKDDIEFRVNVKNPNVISLEIDLKSFYLDAIYASMNEIPSLQAVASLSRQGFTFEKLYPDQTDVIELIKGLVETERVDKVRSELKRRYGKEFKDRVDLNIFVEFAIKLFLETYKTPNPSVLIKASSKLNPISVQQFILDKIRGENFKVRVKTIPMFNVANSLKDMLKSSTLLFDDFEVQGVLLGDIGFDRDSTFSGHYIIESFKHKITSNDVSSEFGLIRTTRKIPNKTDIEIK